MRYRFLTLFVALLATMLIYPVLRGPGGSVLAANLLVTAICGAGARVMLGETRRGTLKMLVTVPPVLGLWLGYFAPQSATDGMVVFIHAFAMSFHLLMLYVVLRSVYLEDRITADGVFGAMCGYLLLGFAFSHGYGIVETLNPHSFQTGDTLTRADEHLVLTYFSFVTLTTVGFGDVVPAVPLARSLAIVEAIVGQFYIAVLVADLIGKRLAHSMEAAPPTRP